MKYFVYLLFIVILLSACKHHVDDVRIIDFKQNLNVNPEDILETTFIKLETNENCFLGNYVAQIEATQGKIFILSGGNKISLLVFDFSGKFCNSIGSKGAGPGEYIMPVSFSINNNKHIISIVDMAQKKIINYSIDDYKFLSENRMEYDSFCFEYCMDDKMIWKNASYQGVHSELNFIESDVNQRFLYGYVNKEFKTGYSTGPAKNIYKINGQVFAYAQYNPFIYQFLNDNAIPVYQLKFGNHQLPPVKYLEQVSANNVNFISTLNASDYISYYCVFETGNTFSVYYTVAKTPYIGIYDKENGQIYQYSKQEFQDKMRIGEMERPVGIIDDYVVALLQPYDLLEKNANGYIFMDKLQSIVLKSLTDDDNPILFMFKVRR
jgi:hypothetical protein